jgi:hypothetical protein
LTTPSADINNFTTTSKLRPNIVEIFGDLKTLEKSIVQVANHLSTELKCEDSMNVYQPFKNEVCTNFAGNKRGSLLTDRASVLIFRRLCAGSFALSASIYFMLAWCMCPGIVLG